MIQLISTANIGTTGGVKTLVYGKAGVGKTRLCATAPTPVIISAEAGLLSLKDYNLPVIEVHNYIDLQQAYLWAMQSQEARQFQTICLDSITEIAEVILGAEKFKAGKDPRRAYGETQDQMIALLRAFRDLPNRNIYITAKQETIKDGLTGGLYQTAMLTGNKLPQHVPYFFDLLMQLVVGRDQQNKEFRALRTRPDNANDAKDRSGKLDEWEPPDLSYIFNKINQGK